MKANVSVNFCANDVVNVDLKFLWKAIYYWFFLQRVDYITFISYPNADGFLVNLHIEFLEFHGCNSIQIFYKFIQQRHHDMDRILKGGKLF